MRRSAVPVGVRAHPRSPQGLPTNGMQDRSRNDLVRTAPRRLSRPGALDTTGQPVVDEPAPAPVRGERRSSCPFRATLPPRPPTTPQRSTPTAADPEATAPDEILEAHPLQAGAPVSDAAPTFAELGVRPEIVRALAEAGIERTFAIQELTLPLALAGEDIIGQARTGMGKTLGFGVPLLQRVVPPSDQPADGEQARPQPATCHRRSSWCPPASCACRWPRTSPTPACISASASPPSTAAAPTSRSWPRCVAGSTSWSARPDACSTSPSSATSYSAGSAPSCSTRPTRCSTWASCPTSSASCGCSPSSATPCCSRPPCPARSSPCPGRS